MICFTSLFTDKAYHFYNKLMVGGICSAFFRGNFVAKQIQLKNIFSPIKNTNTFVYKSNS